MSDLRFIIFHEDSSAINGIPLLLNELGYDTAYNGDVEAALEMMEVGEFNVGVYDLSCGGDSVEMLKKISESKKIEWLILLTDDATMNIAVIDVCSEACAYLNKPVKLGEFRQIVDNIAQVHELRSEIQSKSQRLSRLEVINEIVQEAIVARDEDSFLWKVAHIVNEKLSYFNVNMFLVDEISEKIVLKAFAGGFADALEVGFSLEIGKGISGWVAKSREPFLVGDVRNEPQRERGFDFEENIRSELAVPVIAHDQVLGIVHVESEEINAFSRDDVIMLETIADQMALAFDNLRLSYELFEAYELSSTVNDALPVSIILVDTGLTVRYVNRTFCETVYCDADNVLNKKILDYFSEELLEKMDFQSQLYKVFETGMSICQTNVPHASDRHSEKLLNITLAKVQAGRHPRVMILIQDVTEFSKKTRQLSLIREISIAMQGVFERDKLLHMILTSVTAGFAMGFNRAFLFLLNREENKLKGVMGVGPRNEEEAHQIWGELAHRSFTLDDYMAEVSNGTFPKSMIDDKVVGKSFDINADENILTKTIRSAQHMHVVDAFNNPDVDDSMKDFVVSDEFVTMPLIAKSEVIGVIVADNPYSKQPILEEAIDELSMFASSAALAIENAHMLQVLENQVKEIENAYLELEKTHDMLVRHEKLAAIGEVSTRLAHEIRNPLATIGGFAKSIPRKYEDRDRTIRNAEIIIEEVRRLENILTNVLDFTKAGTPKKEDKDINELIKETMRIMEGQAGERNVVIVLELANTPLIAAFDSHQIKQVLINIIQNAFNAMADGGALQLSARQDNDMVRVEAHDTGCGIPDEFLEKIFDPFFTTRHDGTGLGLAISQRIIQNHRGTFDLQSIEGEGTTITILLPAGS